MIVRIIFLMIIIGIFVSCSEPTVDKACSEIESKHVSCINEEVELWSNGIIPYEFSSEFPEEKKHIVISSMRYWEKLTRAVNFVTRNGEAKYLLINWVETKRCQSSIGSKKPCKLNFSDYCRVPSTYYHELGHVLGLIHEHQRPKSRKKGGLTYNDRAYDLVNDSLGIKKAKALKRTMYDTVTVKFENTFFLYNDLDFDPYSIMGYGSKLNNPKGDIYKLLDNNDTNVYQRANCDEIISPIDISVGDVVKIRKLYPKMFRFFNNTNSNLYAKVFLDFSVNPYLVTIIPGDSLSLRVGEDEKKFILINDYTDVYVTKILFAGAELNEGLYFEENRITYQSSECTSVLAKQFTETNPIDIYLGTAVSENGLDGKGGMNISMFWSNSTGASMLTDLTPTSLVCEVTEL